MEVDFSYSDLFANALTSLKTELSERGPVLVGHWESFVSTYLDYHDYTTESLSSLIDAVVDDVGGYYLLGWAFILVYLALLLPDSYDTSHKLPIQDPQVSIANVTPLGPAASSGLRKQPHFVLPGRNTLFVWLPILLACDLMTVWSDVATHGLPVLVLLFAGLAFVLTALEAYDRLAVGVAACSGDRPRRHGGAVALTTEVVSESAACVFNGVAAATYLSVCVAALIVFILFRDLAILAQIQYNSLVRLYYCYFADRGRYTATLLLLAGIRQYRHDYVVDALQAGAFVNFRNEFGQTPLMVATLYNNLEAVDALCSGVYIPGRARPRRQWRDGREGGEGTEDCPGEEAPQLQPAAAAGPYTDLYLDGLDLDGQNLVNLACLYNYIPILLKLVRYVQQLEELPPHPGHEMAGNAAGAHADAGATSTDSTADAAEGMEPDPAAAAAEDTGSDCDSESEEITLPMSAAVGGRSSDAARVGTWLLRLLPKEVMSAWRGLMSSSFARGLSSALVRGRNVTAAVLGLAPQSQSQSWEAVLRRRQIRVMNLLGGNRNFISYSNHVLDVVTSVLMEQLSGYLTIVARVNAGYRAAEEEAEMGAAGKRKPRRSGRRRANLSLTLSLYSLTHHVSPLYICCKHSYYELMFIILNCLTSGAISAGPRVGTAGGYPGSGAGIRSKMEIMRSVKCYDRYGNNILLWCTAKSSLLNVEHLLSHCLPPHTLFEYLQSRDHSGKTPVILACSRNWREGLRLLVSFGASLEDATSYPLASPRRGGLVHYCVRLGCLESLRYCLEEAGMSAETIDGRNGYNALLTAVAHRHTHIARYLLENGYCSLDAECSILQRLSLADGSEGAEAMLGLLQRPSQSLLLEAASGDALSGDSGPSPASVAISPPRSSSSAGSDASSMSPSPLPGARSARSDSLCSAADGIASVTFSSDARAGSTAAPPSPFLHSRRTPAAAAAGGGASAAVAPLTAVVVVAGPVRSPMLSRYPPTPVHTALSVAAGLATPEENTDPEAGGAGAGGSSPRKKARSKIKPRVVLGPPPVSSPPPSGGLTPPLSGSGGIAGALAVAAAVGPPTDAALLLMQTQSSVTEDVQKPTLSAAGGSSAGIRTPPGSSQGARDGDTRAEAEADVGTLGAAGLGSVVECAESKGEVEPETDTECDDTSSPPPPPPPRTVSGASFSDFDGGDVDAGDGGGLADGSAIGAAEVSVTEKSGSASEAVEGNDASAGAEGADATRPSAIVTSCEIDSGSDIDSDVSAAEGMVLAVRRHDAEAAAAGLGPEAEDTSVLPLSTVRVRAADRHSARDSLPWPLPGLLAALWAVLDVLFGGQFGALWAAVAAPLLAMLYTYNSGMAFAGTDGGRFSDFNERSDGTRGGDAWAPHEEARSRHRYSSYVNTVGAEALVLASENTDLDTMRLLLRHAGEQTGGDGTSHHGGGSSASVADMLVGPQSGASLAHDGYSALSLAVINGRVDLLLGVISALCTPTSSAPQHSYSQGFGSDSAQSHFVGADFPTSTPIRGQPYSNTSPPTSQNGRSYGYGTPMHTLPVPPTNGPAAAGHTRNQGITNLFRLLRKLDANGLTPLMLCCYNNNLRMLCCLFSALAHHERLDAQSEVSFHEQFPYVHMYPPPSTPMPATAAPAPAATPMKAHAQTPAFHTAMPFTPGSSGWDRGRGSFSVAREIECRRRAEFEHQLESVVNCRSAPLQLSCFMIACINNCMAIAQCLIDHHCDVNAVNAAGATAVMLTAALGLVPITKWLVCVVKVDIFRVDSRGLTALMYACKAQQHEIIKLLLSVHPALPFQSAPATAAGLDKDKPVAETTAPAAAAAASDASFATPAGGQAPASPPRSLRRTKTSRELSVSVSGSGSGSGAESKGANSFTVDVHTRVVLVDVLRSLVDQVETRVAHNPIGVAADKRFASGSSPTLSDVRKRLGVPPIAIGVSKTSFESRGGAAAQPPELPTEPESLPESASDVPPKLCSPRHVDYTMGFAQAPSDSRPMSSAGGAPSARSSAPPSTGAAPVAAAPVYYNALCIAVLTGDLTSVRLLLQHGSNVDCVVGQRLRRVSGETVIETVNPLLVAAEAYDLLTDIAVVAYLVTKGGASVTEELLSALQRSRTLLMMAPLTRRKARGSSSRRRSGTESDTGTGTDTDRGSDSDSDADTVAEDIGRSRQRAQRVQRLDRVIEYLELHYYLPVAARPLAPTAASAGAGSGTGAGRAVAVAVTVGTHRLPRYYRMLHLLTPEDVHCLDAAAVDHLRRLFLHSVVGGGVTHAPSANATATETAAGAGVVSPTNRRLFPQDAVPKEVEVRLSRKDRDVLYYLYVRLLSTSYDSFERAAAASAAASSTALMALSAAGRAYWAEAKCLCYDQWFFVPVCTDEDGGGVSDESGTGVGSFGTRPRTLAQVWSRINALRHQPAPPVSLARTLSRVFSLSSASRKQGRSPVPSRTSTFSASSPLGSASNSFYAAFGPKPTGLTGTGRPLNVNVTLPHMDSSLYGSVGSFSGSSTGGSFMQQRRQAPVDGELTPSHSGKKLRNKRKNEKRRTRTSVSASASAASSPARDGGNGASFSRSSSLSSSAKSSPRRAKVHAKAKAKAVGALGGDADVDADVGDVDGEITTDLRSILKSLTEMAHGRQGQPQSPSVYGADADTRGSGVASGGAAKGRAAGGDMNVQEFHCHCMVYLHHRLQEVRQEAGAPAGTAVGAAAGSSRGGVSLTLEELHTQLAADDNVLCYLNFVLGLTRYQLDAYNKT